MTEKSVKVILDTNILVSLLIGKKMNLLTPYFLNSTFLFIFSQELLQEFNEITQRKKFRKYFPIENVNALIKFFIQKYPVFSTNSNFTFDEDKKDSFLFDLINESNAEFLITGDLTLLNLKSFQSTEIINFKQFLEKFPPE